MSGIQLPINGLWADVTHGEDVKARADAQARLLDAILNPHWAIDLTSWDGDGFPDLDVSGFGGPIVDENGVTTTGGAWGPFSLTDDDVNFVERDAAGVVSVVLGGFTPDSYPMYEITVAGGAVTGIVDHRVPSTLPNLAVALKALRSLAPAADKLAYYDGASSAQLTTLSAFMRTVLDDANAATAAATLSVLALAGGTLTGALILAADPVTALGAATKQYVDAIGAGFDMKASVRVKTTGNVNLANALENGDTIDGVVLATGDRVLVASQTAPEENGIYVVPAAGAAARSADADAWAELPGAFVAVEVGTANADTLWLCTSDQGGTLGVTAVVFTQFGITGPHTHTATDISDSTAAGRALLTAADEDAQRAALGVANFSLQAVIGDGVNVIPAGIWTDLFNDVAAGEIVEITMLGDLPSGSIVVDIWKCTFAQFDNAAHPVVGDAITGGGKPTIAAAPSVQTAALAGTAIALGSVLRLNVDSASGFTRVLFSMKLART